MGHFDELARKFADEFAGELSRSADRGETCDFVRGFAQKLPLAAIGEMMGLPAGDWMRLKQITNVMIGAPEPTFFREGENRIVGVLRALDEMTEYMLQIIDTCSWRTKCDLALCQSQRIGRLGERNGASRRYVLPGPGASALPLTKKWRCPNKRNAI